MQKPWVTTMDRHCFSALLRENEMDSLHYPRLWMAEGTGKGTMGLRFVIYGVLMPSQSTKYHLTLPTD